jgi:uncharacterized Zn finger protein (UPF0148 family)
VALTRVACPECGNGLKSSSGFVAGQSVSCPKCETEFTVEDVGDAAPARADDDYLPASKRASSADKEWSYQNSPMRYAVLGVLLVVLGVLGYMLYEKKMKERNETAGTTGDDDRAETVNPKIVGDAPKGLKPMRPGGAGGGGPMVADPLRKAKSKSEPVVPSMDDMKAALVGKWEHKRDKEVHTVEYTADGSFTYGVAKDGAADKPISGKWRLNRVQEGSDVPPATVAILHLEWTVEGKQPLTEVILLRRDGNAGHPLIDADLKGKEGDSVFTKKK